MLSSWKHFAGKEKFDWRKQESILNGLPNFRVPIEVGDFGTLRIHFVWHKSSKRDAIPLLLVHGWPGGFWEFSKVLESLSNPADDGDPAFHIVVPSYDAESPPPSLSHGFRWIFD